MADSQIPAGWYPDPAGDVTKIRYWDGQAWTDQTQLALNPEFQANAAQQQTYTGALVTPDPVYAPGQSVPVYSTAQPATDRSGFAIASLVLGILGILLCCLSWVATLPGILAVIFGCLGIKSSKKTMSIVGLICGIVAILLGIVVFALIAAALGGSGPLADFVEQYYYDY